METYLDAIVAAHREQALSDSRTVATLEQSVKDAPPTRPFEEVLAGQSQGIGVIAEIKRRSPVMGEIGGDLDLVATATAYERGGARCISVLTDVDHFGGSPQDLKTVRAATTLPILRKDFTVCDADLYDARAMGADAVLLIVAALSDKELLRFAQLAHHLSLACLVEVHDEAEVDRAMLANVRLIGVNQRDLHTFQVDTSRAVRVRSAIPSGVTAVAESGIRDVDDAQVLADAGYDAVLVGSSVVTSDDPEKAVRRLAEIPRQCS